MQSVYLFFNCKKNTFFLGFFKKNDTLLSCCARKTKDIITIGAYEDPVLFFRLFSFLFDDDRLKVDKLLAIRTYSHSSLTSYCVFHSIILSFLILYEMKDFLRRIKKNSEVH